MSVKNCLSIAVMAAMIFLSAPCSWSQEAPAVAAEKTSATTEPQWLWGEVETVNTAAKTLQVKYLDYDTDIEKELVIAVDDKTKFENAKGLEEIKAQDTVSVDYLVNADGTNNALDISVEKLEDMDAMPADLQEPAVERVGSDPAASAVEPAAVPAQPAMPSENKE
jgi:hypothetical protein